jgi:mRNA interferase RelE/StbE
MGSFRIDSKGSLEHDLRKIDKRFIPKILDAIESLSEDPFPVQSRKLTGSESSYRLRVGDYRVIYRVDIENKTVTIYHARHRKDVYKK